MPQDSILGTLLFTIYINDIISSSSVFKLIMYANDTTLVTTTNKFTIDQLAIDLNGELTTNNEWLTVNKLSLNINKTKAMILHTPQQKVHLPILQIADSKIEYVDNFNFLGIFIDKHLYWNAHINKIACKISKTTGILNTFKHILPPYIIYLSLIQCHLNYGILGHKTNRKEP